jgi:chromosome segregation ATPase
MDIDSLRNDINKLEKMFEPLLRVSAAVQEFDKVNTELNDKKSYISRQKKELDKVNEDLALAKADYEKVMAEIEAERKAAKEEISEMKKKAKDKCKDLVDGAQVRLDHIIIQQGEEQKNLSSLKKQVSEEYASLMSVKEKIRQAQEAAKNILTSPIE